MTEIEPIDWEGRLRSAVEETVRKREAKREERRQFAEARQIGLQRRHAAKESRTNPRGSRGHSRGRGATGDPMPDSMQPCCAEAGEPPCPHREGNR